MASDPDSSGRGRQLLNSIGTMLQKARRDHSPFTRSGDAPRSAVAAAEASADGSGSSGPSSGGQLQWQPNQQQQATIQRHLDSAKEEFQGLQNVMLGGEDSYVISSAVELGSRASAASPDQSEFTTAHDNWHGGLLEAAPAVVGSDVSKLPDSWTSAGADPTAQLAEALSQLAARDQQVQVLMQQVKRLSNYVDASMDDTVGSSQQAEVQHLNHKLLERSAELSSTQDQLVAVVEAKAQLQRQVSALKLLLADKVRECAALAAHWEKLQDDHTALQTQLEQATVSAEAAVMRAAAAEEAATGVRIGLDEASTKMQELKAAANEAFLDSRAAYLQRELEAAARALDNANKAAAQSAQREQDLTWLLAVRDETIAAQARCIASMEQQLEGCQLQVQELRALVQVHEQNSALFADPAAPSSSAALQQSAGESTASTGSQGTGPSSSAAATPAAPPTTSLTGAAIAWLHNRDNEQLVKAKDELKERDKAIKELLATTSRLDNQIHGLKAVLVAKGAQCNRLDLEARQAESKLRACQAAAATEGEALRCALSDASSEVARLRSLLDERCAREAVLSRELAITRAQVQDLLDALAADAEQLLRSDPAECARVRSESPAILAEVAAAHGRPGVSDADVEADLQRMRSADRSMSLSSWEAVSLTVTRAGSTAADAGAVGGSGPSSSSRTPGGAFDSVRQTILGKLRAWDEGGMGGVSGRRSSAASGSPTKGAASGSPMKGAAGPAVPNATGSTGSAAPMAQGQAEASKGPLRPAASPPNTQPD